MKGYSELFLFVAVCAAAWTRTPLGAIGHNLTARWHGGETVSVLDHFRTEIPAQLQHSLQEAFTQIPPPPPPPAPTVAAETQRAAVRAHLGDEALAAVDALLAEGHDFEAALEIHAIGAELRDRAIARARAAGAREPERLDSHSRYLPAQAAQAAQAGVSEVASLATVLDLRWPVDPAARISSPFGERMHPILKRRKFHNGVDVSVPTGTPIHAAGDGRVVRAREDDVSGKYVVLSHGHGVTTSYCHGSIHRAAEGAEVAQGDLILDSGSTGRSTGPHLHFTLKIGGRATDPIFFHEAGAAADVNDPPPAEGAEDAPAEG